MKKLFFFFMIVFLPLSVFGGEVRDFPFVGVVSGNNVNVRAGANRNFEVITKLNKEEKVMVLAESYGWYKIELPQKAVCYISSDYIEESKQEGTIKANRVNVRCGAGTKSSIVGQLNRKDKVVILGKHNGWFKIKPPEGSAAWMHSGFVKYHSTKKAFLEEQEKKRLAKIKKEEEERLRQLEEEKKKQVKPEKPKPKPVPPLAQGYVEDAGRVLFRRRGTHKLLNNKGKIISYLKSDQCNLNDYVFYEVRVWGDELNPQKAKIPVIIVKKIEVVK